MFCTQSPGLGDSTCLCFTLPTDLVAGPGADLWQRQAFRLHPGTLCVQPLLLPVLRYARGQVHLLSRCQGRDHDWGCFCLLWALSGLEITEALQMGSGHPLLYSSGLPRLGSQLLSGTVMATLWRPGEGTRVQH